MTVSPGATGEPGLIDRARRSAAEATAKVKSAGGRHASIAVPFRAFDRNRRVAASVLAGGLGYRFLLWLLPFGLIVGGALGFGDASSTEDAASHGAIPAAVVNMIGDIARAANANSWWLLLTGIPLLLWEGYAGAKAFQLVHSLIWRVPPPRTRAIVSSLYFSAVMCAFMVVISLTWWFRDSTDTGKLVIGAVMVVPLAAVWLVASLHLPHGAASWKELLPGAFLVAVGFQLSHSVVVYFFGPKLTKATSLYGALGVATTLLFFLYVAGRVVVSAPVLNYAIHEERRRRREAAERQ